MNINELEELAKAATPGPWHWECDDVKGDPYNRKRYQVTAIGKTVTRIYYSSFEGGPTNAEDDAKHIAATNPSAILELIAAYREAVAALEYGWSPFPDNGLDARKWADEVFDTAKRLGVE